MLQLIDMQLNSSLMPHAEYVPFPLQTLLEGISLGTLVTYYDVDLVLKAFVITTAVFLGLTAYTMQSKYDFSTWGAR